jgi:DNA-binding HxlR family transcriptional regulator
MTENSTSSPADGARLSKEAELLLCPVARALSVVGERWTLLIIRDLLRFGARRFQDFEESLAGVSPNTLSSRLKRLDEAGVIARRFYAQHPPRAEYVLTEKGRDLAAVVLALKSWGEKYGDGGKNTDPHPRPE